MAGQLVQALLGLDQLVVGGQAGALALDRVDGVQQGRRQAVEVVLQQIVGCTVTHGPDGGVFADLAGDEDEGQQQSALLQRLQHLQAGEARQVVVRDDGVPGAIQRGQHGRQGVQPFHLDLEPGAGQLGEDELMVELGILDMQHAQDAGRPLHTRNRHGGAVCRRPRAMGRRHTRRESDR